MNTVADFFLFNGATLWTLVYRLLVLIVFAAFGLYLLNFIWLLFYDKFKEPSFILFAQKGFLYSLCVIVVALSLEWYYLIIVNGVQWFKWRRFPLDFHNTYLLILPEMILLGSLFLLFFYRINKIKRKL